MRNQEEKIELQKKVHRRICVLHAFLPMSLSVAFFVFSLHLPKEPTCWMAPIKTHNIAMVGILCDDTMSEQSQLR